MPTHTRAERAKKSSSKKAIPKKSAAKKTAPKNFIKAAIKTPGGLRKNLRKKFKVKLPESINIPKALVTKATKLRPTSKLNKLLRQEGNFAKTLAKLRPKKKKKR